MMENFIKIMVLENEFEAQILESVLQEREIPHFLKSYHDEVYGRLFQMNKGWGAVNAPERYKVEIEEIVADLRKGYTWEDQ
jgi:hypothetical protein